MQRYLATAVMCLKEKGYFGLMELVGQYLLRIATLVALCFVWRTLFGQGVSYDGMSLGQMLSYTVLGSALAPILTVRTPASGWMHDGTILSMYLRPSSLFGQLTAHTMGGWLMPLIIYTLPVLIFAPMLGISLVPATPWFFLSMPLAIAQGFAVDYLFACLLIRMKNLEWTVHSMRQALDALFTGALIPFAALPWGMGRWLSLSPLGTLSGAPLALFAGLDSPARLIPAQLFWTAVLWPLAIWCFKRSSERMVGYGG